MPRLMSDLQAGNGSIMSIGKRSYIAVSILLLNALVAFGCLELAATAFFKMATFRADPAEQLRGEGTLRETVSYYASQDWAKLFWHEFRLSRKNQFYSHVGWRRAPFHGQTIDIDSNGIRVTPGADCRQDAFKVFTFGASEMWGTGSPNWETIPAHLQQGLETLRAGPVCVTNFAESAYVSMQSIIMLLMQLRAGNVPDIVLFYTLTDDVYAGYQSGRAGVIENLEQITARFEGRKAPETIASRLQQTQSFMLIDLLMSKLTMVDPE